MTIISSLFAFLSAKAGGLNAFGEKISEPNREKQIVFAILSGLAVYLVMALRYDIGTDYSLIYVPRFYAFKNPDAVIKWEPVYWFMNKLFASIVDNPQVIFIVSSLLIVVPLWITIFKMSSMPWLSVILFVIGRHFFISLNGVRQYTAFAFIMLAFTFIPKRKFVPYALCIVFATLCHYSVIVFLPMWVLIYLKISPKQSMIFLGFSALITPYLRSFTRWLVSLTKYRYYFGTKYDLPDRYNEWTLLEQIFVFVIILLIIEERRIQEDELPLRFLFNLNLVNVWFAFNINLIPLGERMSWAFEFPTLLLLPLCISRIRGKKKAWALIICIIIVYLFIMYCRVVIMKDHRILPYQMFFGKF
ncbi:MAG: EpsG family protein [Oscillospiraceae bacterium]|nr:EpsG family protein [Oscillospiraceae bacterium]